MKQDKQSYFQEIKSNGTAATNLILNIFTVVLFVRGAGGGGLWISRQKQEPDSKYSQRKEKHIFVYSNWNYISKTW